MRARHVTRNSSPGAVDAQLYRVAQEVGATTSVGICHPKQSGGQVRFISHKYPKAASYGGMLKGSADQLKSQVPSFLHVHPAPCAALQGLQK